MRTGGRQRPTSEQAIGSGPSGHNQRVARSTDDRIRVIRSSGGYRVGVGAAVAAGLLLLAFSGWVPFALFGILGALALADMLRSEVTIDLDRRIVFSRRAVRTWSGAFEDIANVRVPPWGPVLLTLDPDRRTRGTGPWRGQVATGVYAQRTGSNGQACQIADLLGVEVVSVWPQVKPGPGNGQQSLRELWGQGPGSTSSTVVALIAAVCVVVAVGLTVWGLFIGP